MQVLKLVPIFAGTINGGGLKLASNSMKLPAYAGTKNDTYNDRDNPWLRVLKMTPKLTETVRGCKY